MVIYIIYISEGVENGEDFIAEEDEQVNSGKKSNGLVTENKDDEGDTVVQQLYGGVEKMIPRGKQPRCRTPYGKGPHIPFSPSGKPYFMDVGQSLAQ